MEISYAKYASIDQQTALAPFVLPSFVCALASKLSSPLSKPPDYVSLAESRLMLSSTIAIKSAARIAGRMASLTSDCLGLLP